MPFQPDGAGEGPLPKSLILATKGVSSAPKFIIVGMAGSRDGFPKNLIVGGSPRLQPHPTGGFPGFPRSRTMARRRAGEGRRAFPKSFILVHFWSAAAQMMPPFQPPAGAPTADRFPKNLTVGASPHRFNRLPRRRAGQARQGGRTSPNPSYLRCPPVEPRLSWRSRIDHTGSLRFSYPSQRRQRFPQNPHNTAPNSSFYSPNPS